MAKRKTRQQKIIADLRRQLLATKEGSGEKHIAASVKKETEIKKENTFKLIPQTQIKETTTNVKHLAYTNPYLTKDLRKTAILTTGIVLGQLILFFLLKQHLLILPGISY